MDDDWNPYFERKKKRNRVSRGKPQRQRRYFVAPVAWLIVGVWAWQVGALPAALQRIDEKAVEAYAWLRTPGHRDDEALQRQLERGRIVLANANAVIDALQAELDREKSARLQREINEAFARGSKTGKEQQVVIRDNVQSGSTGTCFDTEGSTGLCVAK